jgi:curved DNA-binding protein CbpA
MLRAADVLSDPEARRQYDQYGAAGMARHGGAAAGAGNSRQAWDEFKVRRSPGTCLLCGAIITLTGLADSRAWILHPPMLKTAGQGRHSVYCQHCLRIGPVGEADVRSRSRGRTSGPRRAMQHGPQTQPRRRRRLVPPQPLRGRGKRATRTPLPRSRRPERW